jgi:hypothetical protein
MKISFLQAAFVATVISTAGLLACKSLPGAPSAPGVPGGIPSTECDLRSGGDVGRKLQAFLDASVTLQASVKDLTNSLRDACADFGRELGMTAGLDGDTKTVCKAVADQIKADMAVSLKPGAKLTINYKPAECRVKLDAGASAMAECEGNANVDAGVRCEGTCQGTCKGACQGTCASKGADGQCNGQCNGQCGGSCSGTCEGHAEASGSAECKAAAEVHANMEADCTPPELQITFAANIVKDAARLERLVKAIKNKLPKILALRAKVTGPVMSAVKNYVATAKDLAAAAPKISQAFKEAAMCVSAKLAAAANMAVEINVSVEVSVSASAEVGGACGAGG